MDKKMENDVETGIYIYVFTGVVCVSMSISNTSIEPRCLPLVPTLGHLEP